jgi:hypothetical protein
MDDLAQTNRTVALSLLGTAILLLLLIWFGHLRYMAALGM